MNNPRGKIHCVGNQMPFSCRVLYPLKRDTLGDTVLEM